jgi:ribosomal protein L37AE/L43A
MASAILAATVLLLGCLLWMRRRSTRRRLADIPASDPDSESPAMEVADKKEAKRNYRRPARRLALTQDAGHHCIHCKSTDVRQSRIHPHRMMGINFTEYYRCRHCGRHFAIVSYTPIILAGSGIVVVLTLLSSSLMYLLSQGSS